MLEDNQWYGTMFPRIPAKHLIAIRKNIAKARGKFDVKTPQKGDNGDDKRSRSRSPSQKKKRRDPRDLDDRPSSSSSRFF